MSRRDNLLHSPRTSFANLKRIVPPDVTCDVPLSSRSSHVPIRKKGLCNLVLLSKCKIGGNSKLRLLPCSASGSSSLPKRLPGSSGDKQTNRHTLFPGRVADDAVLHQPPGTPSPRCRQKEDLVPPIARLQKGHTGQLTSRKERHQPCP